MDKLRIGVWLQEGYKSTVGGGYGYYTSMVEAIGVYSFAQTEVVFLTDTPVAVSHIGNKRVWVVTPPPGMAWYHRLLRAVSFKVPGLGWLKAHYRRRDTRADSALTDLLYAHCDLVYYLVPGCRFPQFPYLYTLWDLGHLSTYAFPELAQAGRFESRKAHHDMLPHKALLVFCETEAGKKEAVAYLRINPARLRVLPLIPAGLTAPAVSAIKPSGIAEGMQFIHYPAQYWAHKNHVGLLRAFGELLIEYPSLYLVLCGGDQGNYSYVKSQIRAMSLDSRVIDLGFISTEELKWLYQHSRGMVMPTLLGPSNMPPLEALALGCPVAVSDFPGHRELLGDNALYFNPLDYQDMARAIRQVLEMPRPAPVSVPTAADNMPRLDKYFAEVAVLRSMWGKQ